MNKLEKQLKKIEQEKLAAKQKIKKLQDRLLELDQEQDSIIAKAIQDIAHQKQVDVSAYISSLQALPEANQQ